VSSIVTMKTQLCVLILAFSCSQGRPAAQLDQDRTMFVLYNNNKLLTVSESGVVFADPNVTVDQPNTAFLVKPYKYVSHTVRHVDTCKYICINPCGRVYAADEPNAECELRMNNRAQNIYIFRKTAKRNLFLALNGAGKPRPLVTAPTSSNSKYSKYIDFLLSPHSNKKLKSNCLSIVDFDTKMQINPKQQCVDQKSNWLNRKISKTVDSDTNESDISDDDNDDAVNGTTDAMLYSYENEPEINIKLLKGANKTSHGAHVNTQSKFNTSLEEQIKEIINNATSSMPQTPFVINVFNTNIVHSACMPEPLTFKKKKQHGSDD
jgi:Fibroblast growth factor